MGLKRRNVLVIGVDPSEFGRAAPLLRREEFEVDRFPGPKGAVELIARVPFVLLVVRYPLPGMEIEAFLAEVRKQGSPCRKASLLLLASDGDLRAARALVGRGANRVVPLARCEKELVAAVSALSDVAPRKEARYVARLEVRIDDARDVVFCQTENLSASGMLLVTDRRYRKGTRIHFELRVPGEERPVAGVAEVVRHTLHGREKVGGLGVRFVSFVGDAGRRLARHVASE